MRRPSTSLLLALGLALLVGCSPSPSSSTPTGSARFAVSSRQALTSDISRVTVTTSAADISSISVDLSLSNGVWGGIIGDIPAGPERTFQAQAFDYWGSVRFEGTVSGVTIEPDQSSLVAITLQELNAPPPFSNEAPIIDALVVSSSSVSAGGTISLEATAHDPNASDSLWYSWSSTDGYFSSDFGSTATWTAPYSAGAHTLTLTVTDSAGTSSSISLDVAVQDAAQGGAELSISFNSSPGVSAVSASLSPLEVGQTTTVSATAEDADGDELSYSWSATCEGYWDSPYSSTAQFMPTELPSGACNNCNLMVSVSDGKGGQSTGTVALCVNNPSSSSHAPPSIVRSYRSSDTASASQVLTYEVVASDPEGSSLSFSWAANAGSLGFAANGDSNSRITWTAPLCLVAGVTPAITATVTNAFSMTATRSFVVTGLPVCPSGAWASTGSLASRRAKHTAMLLPNGKVLATGGGIYRNYSYDALATAEVYDPASGTWGAVGTMASPRYEHTATLLPNGKVLVVGGYTSSTALATAELYDPATGTWSATGTMAASRHAHTATLLPNGKVLVVGGYNYYGNLATAELYDPATGTWSATGTMAISRYDHTATLLPNGKVLVAGGYSSYSYGNVSSAEVYDPATGTWSATGSMASPRRLHTATLLPNGKVLIVGGGSTYYANLVTSELYDPATGTWSATGSLNSRRFFLTATLLPNGKVLVAGGADDSSILVNAEVYDPATGIWSVGATMAGPRYAHTATLLPNGDVLVAAGTGPSGTALTTAELYQP
ncbi:kelch repeat-containing protein [Hyalangium sp.]|uniref:kelch repeat-containing protein n=1 Tax=Hyalangium sp. TaxID=2028555 RepID=UPI002D461AD5|nr:kelch repeat-containing protein [Hyalangium sp.]HYH97926.1 kelch repeat-containing protein [Hyalangium sp.]